MSNELLMIMTSNGALGDSGRPTGVWVEEVCVPLKAFRDAGFIVSSAAVAQAVTAAVRNLPQ
jgi:putative intracellular protease/amidase